MSSTSWASPSVRSERDRCPRPAAVVSRPVTSSSGCPRRVCARTATALARRLFFDIAGSLAGRPRLGGCHDAPLPTSCWSRRSSTRQPCSHAILAATEVHAIAHITGGGIPGNVNARVEPARSMRTSSRPDGVANRPRVFAELQRDWRRQLDDRDGGQCSTSASAWSIVVSPGTSVDAATRCGCLSTVVAILGDRRRLRPRNRGSVSLS